MTGPNAMIRLHWLPPERGGRKVLPRGPVFATTAYFVGETAADLFSVVFRFPEGAAGRDMGATMRLLAPENLPDVVGRIVPGARLTVTEGPRPVAECEIVSVEPAPSDRAIVGQGTQD